MNRKLLPLLVASLLAVAPAAVTADPPPWAPAHGHRAKHGKGGAEQAEVKVTVNQDIGITTGRCNRETVGALLGGVVGGVVGSQVGRANGNEQLGVAIGSVAGILIGHSIGRQMDAADRQCSVQVLEHARNGQTVQWQNPDNGVEYRFTPTSSVQRGDRLCRQYRAVAIKGGQKEESRREACRVANGEWTVSG